MISLKSFKKNLNKIINKKNNKKLPKIKKVLIDKYLSNSYFKEKSKTKKNNYLLQNLKNINKTQSNWNIIKTTKNIDVKLEKFEKSKLLKFIFKNNNSNKEINKKNIFNNNIKNYQKINLKNLKPKMINFDNYYTDLSNITNLKTNDKNNSINKKVTFIDKTKNKKCITKKKKIIRKNYASKTFKLDNNKIHKLKKYNSKNVIFENEDKIKKELFFWKLKYKKNLIKFNKNKHFDLVTDIKVPNFFVEKVKNFAKIIKKNKLNDFELFIKNKNEGKDLSTKFVKDNKIIKGIYHSHWIKLIDSLLKHENLFKVKNIGYYSFKSKFKGKLNLLNQNEEYDFSNIFEKIKNDLKSEHLLLYNN